MKLNRLVCGVAAGLYVWVGAADAGLVSLMPGDGDGLLGVSGGTHPEIGGTVPTGADLLMPFQIFDGEALLYDGALQTRVVVSDVTNTLLFALRIRDTVGELNGIIANVEYSGFGGWLTDVEWSTTSQGDVGPSRAERSSGAGDTLNFLFGNPFFAPEESRFFFALTDATNYALTGTATIHLTTGQSTTLKVFAPVIPTPGGLALAGMGGLVALARRRRR